MPEPTLKGKLTLTDVPFMGTLKKATAAASKFGSFVGGKLKAGFMSVGGAIKGAVLGPLSALGATAAGLLSFKAFGEGIKGALDLGGELIDLQAQTGGAIDELLILRQVLEDNGVSAEATRGVLNKIQRAVIAAATGGKLAGAGFREIGLNAEDLLKLNPVAQFRAVADAIGKLPDPALRTASAMKIFGKAGGQILGVLSNAPSFEEAAKSIGEQARVLKENAEVFDSISDRLGRSRLKLQGFFVGVASKLAPALDAFSQKLDALDLEKFGEKLGAGFLSGFIRVYGVMANLGKLFEVIRAGFMATAAEFGNAIYNSLAAGFGKFFGRGEPELKDLFGAKELRAQADAAGDSLLGAFLESTRALSGGVKEAKKAAAVIKGTLTNNGGLKGASNAGALSEFQSASYDFAHTLNRKAYGQGGILPAREKRSLMDAAVAAGQETRQGSTAGAFGVVRSGDARRRREVERANERVKLGVDKSNELLQGIKEGTDSWKD